MQILQKLKSISVTLVIAGSLLAGPALLPATATAASGVNGSKSAACEGIGLTGNDCGGTVATNRIGGIVKTIINLLSVIVGLAAVIMIIVSGFKYITSGGDANKVGSAKTGLIYAVIGLVIVALAQFIVYTVLNEVK